MRTKLHALATLLPALTVVATLGALAEPAHAANFTVNANGDLPDTSPGDGTCVTAMGFCSLRAAVMETNALAGADTVTIGTGGMISLTTTGAGENAAATGDLDIAGDLTIVGNGAVIDGQDSDMIFHVLIGATADISDVTLQNGWGSLVGGAIYNQGDLTLSSCVAWANASTSEGGAIKNVSSLTIDDCQFHENASDRGGAIYSVGDLDITNSDFFLNEGWSHGGAVYATGGASLTNITDSTFADNVAGQRGGGVAVLSALNVSDCRFENNFAGTMGGGLYMYTDSAVVDVFRSDFVGNSADDGGGIHNFWGDLTLRRVGVWNNTATGSGGGVYDSGPLVALRGAIYDNDAASGGGLYVFGGDDLLLKNMTISGNTATGSGGGVWQTSSGAADFLNVTIANNTGASGGLLASDPVTMVNTIVANNHDLGGGNSDCVGSVTSDGHNLIEDTAACTIGGPATGDVYGVAPGLGVLNNNGGETPTHKVLAGSAARNAGDNATCLGIDQRGVSRPLGGVCDIGAYERN